MSKAKCPEQGTCKEFGYISSQEVCKACVLLAGLNKGLPQLGVGKSSKHKKTLEEMQLRGQMGRREEVNTPLSYQVMQW